MAMKNLHKSKNVHSIRTFTSMTFLRHLQILHQGLGTYFLGSETYVFEPKTSKSFLRFEQFFGLFPDVLSSTFSLTSKEVMVGLQLAHEYFVTWSL